MGFQNKYKPHGSINVHKTCLMAKGFTQVASWDFGETFSIIVKINCVHIILTFAKHFDLEVHQFDIKITFLCGILHEKIYMKIPKGLKNPKLELQQVCKLRNSIYDAQQSFRTQYER
jgi:hypothetical protein